ncbi:hypothetical protein IU438_12200 [Nocardia cyriacigeorgica]|uniref:hypothetical protein n=1 Tax=Nocardia cyriacigeorgica TaxID=135487 RepID=UPI001895EB86|nr:hypothetical protein [Nocardia cyriacigeorgica]MBF6088265.1 hypothetical protein [Nocardia cyriacigeorgica]MBF6095374.1 hypothetical protein [Nocardia cyriacigeorgica]MBF6396556.1 hypothetical protein [Nocardia cyriacigeorgica]MBF6402188.1 hypothetical protein [Nocardia cyriacigeorgica]MBF6497371.1 hypothetical protein [Nocardia cyriacigeorgica]
MITATLIVAILGLLRRLRRRDGRSAGRPGAERRRARLSAVRREYGWWRSGRVAASAAALSGASVAAVACVAC